MRKIRAVLLCTLFMVLCVTACGSKTQENKTEEKTTQTETPKKENNETTKPKEEPKEEPKQDTPAASDPVAANIFVYAGNDDATAFAKKEVTIDSLTPENVISALITQGVVSAETKVLSFKQQNENGQKVIILDLNTAFSDYVRNFGTAGEYYAIGGVCNTFLAAYDYDGIQITIEGQTLATGHAEYPGYLHMFE